MVAEPFSPDRPTMSEHSRRKLKVAAVWLLIAAAGIATGSFSYRRQVAHLSEDLVEDTQRSAAAFDSATVQALTGSPADRAAFSPQRFSAGSGGTTSQPVGVQANSASEIGRLACSAYSRAARAIAAAAPFWRASAYSTTSEAGTAT